MARIMTVAAMVALLLAMATGAQAVSANGATADLDMRTRLTCSNGLVLTFVPGHGMNGAYAYVYTDVGGVEEEQEQNLGTWQDDTSSWSASASTTHGAAHGSVTVNTAGFDYSIHADGMVQGLDIGDYGMTLSDAYAWPDWLRADHAGTATFTIEYEYTLDTTDTVDNAEAYVYMNAFFADHAGTNYLTGKEGWVLGYGSNPNTTIVAYGDSIEAGQYVTVSDSVSWDVVIPNMSEPNTWWSTWSYGEAGVEVEPVVPEPATMGLLALGMGAAAVLRSRRRVK
jgi:hypothetical protein